ncbi:MAG: SAM-dependent methyltransferase, partial [Oscillospiraceae bacterium]|nr:SAM-dependent methyltransferase [Oscillospiraceae bacterium]
SYLTFILYYYFAEKLKMKTRIIGYDLKKDVVENCEAIARSYGYDGLSFQLADVTKDKLADTHIDMVVTLHACDVATDYALAYAVNRGVKHIFSVPCCQHEINSSIRKGGELDILLEYGIIKERVSALLTDSIRAAVLEERGYTVDMIEFIDFEHSPKNLMIRAKHSGKHREGGRAKAEELRDKYGFKQTLLELVDSSAKKT